MQVNDKKRKEASEGRWMAVRGSRETQQKAKRKMRTDERGDRKLLRRKVRGRRESNEKQSDAIEFERNE